MRLAKYLALAGVASRRRAEEIIRQGRVQVNGTTVILPQAQTAPGDEVTVDGKAIRGAEPKRYLLLDKPAGYISTVADTHGRKTVLDLLPATGARLYPVGRLDAATEGLLLLTNDGDLAYRLTHPRYGVQKTYRAWVKGIPGSADLHKLAGGVEIDGKLTAPASVTLLETRGEQSLLEITLSEGRKRQVRLMCTAVGCPVLRLRRVRFAFLTGEGLKKGGCRELTVEEVKKLYALVGLPYPG